uniref:Uncharacterized protein n=1 Tax=Octopus bimaculoides TaxID=37653 RepID=A0A0L8IE33_OCTBM
MLISDRVAPVPLPVPKNIYFSTFYDLRWFIS